MNMTMRGSSLWYSTVICNILIYITYDIQHDLSPWELGHGTKSFHCQKLNKIVFKFCHNNCFLFCKDENTSLKLNQMLSQPGLLPVPLSMLTESPPSSCEGDSFSDWPLASVTNIAADILPRPFCLFGSKHSFNAHWFSHKLCMRVTVSVNYCRTYKYYDWHLWLTFISNTTIHLISGDTLAIMCYFSMSLMVVFMAAKTTIMGWWYCEEASLLMIVIKETTLMALVVPYQWGWTKSQSHGGARMPR